MQDNGDRYFIKLVGDDALPAGKDWAFLECGDEVWLALKRSRLTEGVLESAWCAFRHMKDAEMAQV